MPLKDAAVTADVLFPVVIVIYLAECNKTTPEDKKKIYAMKKAGTFEAKKTGVVNTAMEGTSSDDTPAALSVTISRLEHDQYQRFLGVCGEDPVDIFNIGK